MDLTLLLLIAATLALAVWVHLRLCRLATAVEELTAAHDAMLTDMDTVLQPMSLMLDRVNPHQFLGVPLLTPCGRTSRDVAMEDKEEEEEQEEKEEEEYLPELEEITAEDEYLEEEEGAENEE